MRGAFTLVELLISIALFGLITLFLFGSIDHLRKEQSFYEHQEKSLRNRSALMELLRSDLYRPRTLVVSRSNSRDYDALLITGSSRSLYGIERPNVAWIVLKQDNTLVRLESAEPITLPIRPEKLYLVHSDVIAKGCEIFRTYESSSGRLGYLKIENESPLVVEAVR